MKTSKLTSDATKSATLRDFLQRSISSSADIVGVGARLADRRYNMATRGHSWCGRDGPSSIHHPAATGRARWVRCACVTARANRRCVSTAGDAESRQGRSARRAQRARAAGSGMRRRCTRQRDPGSQAFVWCPLLCSVVWPVQWLWEKMFN